MPILSRLQELQVMEDGGKLMNSSLPRSGLQRPKRPLASAKEVGTPPVRSNLCTSLIVVSIAVRSKVTETVSEKQLLRNNSAARKTILP